MQKCDRRVTEHKQKKKADLQLFHTKVKKKKYSVYFTNTIAAILNQPEEKQTEAAYLHHTKFILQVSNHKSQISL